MANKTKEELQLEAKICLNCPFEKCVEEKGKEIGICKYVDEQIKKIKKAGAK